MRFIQAVSYVQEGCTKRLLKCMKAYHFLSVHPEFEVKILTDGNKPPCMNPHSVMTSLSEDLVPKGINRIEGIALNNSFDIHPAIKTRPT